MPIYSHSQLSMYEECPLKYKLCYRDRIKRDVEGIEGFLGNLEDVRSIQDEDTLQWQAFFAAWWEHFQDGAVTADDLARLILPRKDMYGGPAPEPLLESLPEPLLVNRDRGEGSLKRSIGRNLSRLTGRIFDGRKLCDAGVDGKIHVRKWRLISTDAPEARLVTSPDAPNLANNLAQGDEQWQ